MPPAPLLLACSLLDAFRNISAEMCAGSLMSGCSFDVTCFSVHGELGRGCCQIWCPKRVIWHACCAQFGTLGTIERCRGTWEHTEGDLGGPWLGFLSILGGFRGRHLDVFGKLWHNNCVFWHACLQVTFFKDFGVRIWTSGAPESSIWCGRYCKNQLFTYVGIMSILVSFLHGFRWLWDHF